VSRRRPVHTTRPVDPEPAIEDDELDAMDDEYEDEDFDEDGPEPLDAVNADAFFAAEVSTIRPARLVLYDEEYVLPVRTPLAFTLLAERHAEDESMETIRAVLAPIFGEDALDHWLTKGMDQHQFSVVLMWAARNMDRPGSATLADCARRVAEQDARGKALPNRASRRAAGGARSSRTGRS
jgi:hypothetical protein